MKMKVRPCARVPVQRNHIRSLQLPVADCLTLEANERPQGIPGTRITQTQVTNGLPDLGLDADRCLLGCDAAMLSSESTFKTTQSHNPEDHDRHLHRREKLGCQAGDPVHCVLLTYLSI
jgi:hypothetical protein